MPNHMHLTAARLAGLDVPLPVRGEACGEACGGGGSRGAAAGGAGEGQATDTDVAITGLETGVSRHVVGVRARGVCGQRGGGGGVENGVDGRPHGGRRRRCRSGRGSSSRRVPQSAACSTAGRVMLYSPIGSGVRGTACSRSSRGIRQAARFPLGHTRVAIGGSSRPGRCATPSVRDSDGGRRFRVRGRRAHGPRAGGGWMDRDRRRGAAAAATAMEAAIP